MSRQPVERRVALKRGDMCYYEWSGAGENVVLLLHATGFHGRCWDKIVDELPASCHVLAVDMRGHGRSSKQGPFDWIDFGDDVVQFVDALDLTEVVVAGHSMGGHCAVYASALRPRRFQALVLADPVILAPEQYEHEEQSMSAADHPVARRRNVWRSPAEMFKHFEDRHPFSLWRKDVLRDYCEFGLMPDGDAYQLACPPRIEAQIYLGTSKREIHSYFASVTQPVVVMRAKPRTDFSEPMDFATSPTWPSLADALPNGKDRFLPELSHFMPMQRPDLIAAEIRALLSCEGR